MNSQVWWFVARSSGIIAWALLTLSVCWGLLLSTRLLARRVSPAWLLDLHRHLSGLAVVFTGVHLVGLVADSYVTFGWAELFIPMASSWKPGAVAFGIVAFYLLLAVEITSLAMRRLPRSLWRWVHRSSFALFGFMGVAVWAIQMAWIPFWAAGVVNAYAGITLPNVASVALHESLGFSKVGHYPHVGFKHGAWHDVGWWGLRLVDVLPMPP